MSISKRQVEELKRKSKELLYYQIYVPDLLDLIEFWETHQEPEKPKPQTVIKREGKLDD